MSPSRRTTTVPDAIAEVRAHGFAFSRGSDLRTWLGPDGGLDDWARFSESWNQLGADEPLAALGRHRRRRHATGSLGANGLLHWLPHQPHYQSTDYNRLQGGLQRWFEPVEAAVADSAWLNALVQFGHRFFADVSSLATDLLIEIHQFRIEARPGQPGEPTPEGIHRDGVDWVFVVLIDRVNIESGTTTIHAPDGSPLGAFTLSHALDAVFVDDRRVMHGVTPVQPTDPSLPAYRDVLVITYRARGEEV
jgi:hypothetical protein